MQALILVGGEGTRLRPLTSLMPKPIVPLVDRPFMAFMLEWLARHGVDDVIMSCGFLATQVREVLGDGSRYGVALRFVEEPEPRGTAGALKYAEEFLQERFLMLNGDVLSDMDLSAQIAAHERNGARGDAGARRGGGPEPVRARAQKRRRLGARVRREAEAGADRQQLHLGWRLRARARRRRHDPARPQGLDRARDLARARRRRTVRLSPRRYWLDIGKPETYLQATYDILGGAVETSVSADGGTVVGAGCQVAPDASRRAVERARRRGCHRRRQQPRRALGRARPGRRSGQAARSATASSAPAP